MKVSLIKKSKIALRISGVISKVLSSVFALLYLFLMTSNKTDGDMSQTIIDVSGAIGYSCIIAMLFMLSLSMNFTKIGFFQILPLKKNDIIDVIVLENFFTLAIFAVIHGAAAAVFLQTGLLPYFLCAYLVMFALSMVLMPFYIKDRRMYNNIDRFGDDEKAAKRATVKGVVIGIGYMVVSVAIISLIAGRGVKICDPAADAVLLAVLAAAALILTGIMLVVCHRIKTFFGS